MFITSRENDGLHLRNVTWTQGLHNNTLHNDPYLVSILIYTISIGHFLFTGGLLISIAALDVGAF